MNDNVAQLVRETLAWVDQTESAPPAGGPDWAALGDRMSQPGLVRTPGRRIRLIAIAGAALAVVLIVAGVVISFPHNRAADEANRTPVPGHSLLYSQPVKGSLAQDRDLLAAVVAWMEGPAPYRTEKTRPFTPIPGTIRVEFAGDIGDHRTVLVEGDWTVPARGSVPQQIQFWLEGRAGSPADQLAVGRDWAWPPRNTLVRAYGSPGSSDDPARFVVVSARRQLVRQIGGPPQITAGGEVRIPGTVAYTRDGVAIGTVRGSSGLYVSDTQGASGVVHPLSDRPLAMSQQQRTALRGGGIAPDIPASAADRAHMMVSFGEQLADSVRQSRGDGTFQVIAEVAQPVVHADRQPGRAVVGMYTLPNGVRILGTLDVHRVRASGELSWVSTLVDGRIVPAGAGPEGLSYGWIQPGAGPADPGWAGAMGPQGTATVVWLHRDGRTTSTPAQRTVATTRSTDLTQARFLDSAGRTLGSAPLAASSYLGNGLVLDPIVRALDQP